MKQTIAWKQDGNTFVLVHGNQEPADTDWEPYTAAIARHIKAGNPFRALVVTPGPSPSMAQRKTLNEAVGANPALTSVVTESAIGRAVVTILRLRNPGIRAFEPHQLDEAFNHLQVPASEQERLRRLVSDLKTAVS